MEVGDGVSGALVFASMLFWLFKVLAAFPAPSEVLRSLLVRSVVGALVLALVGLGVVGAGVVTTAPEGKHQAIKGQSTLAP